MKVQLWPSSKRCSNADFKWKKPVIWLPCMINKLHNTFLQQLFHNPKTLRTFWNRTLIKSYNFTPTKYDMLYTLINAFLTSQMYLFTPDFTCSFNKLMPWNYFSKHFRLGWNYLHGFSLPNYGRLQSLSCRKPFGAGVMRIQNSGVWVGWAGFVDKIVWVSILCSW